MSIKNKVSTTELLISFVVLGVVVFFCYQMLMRQKRMVTKVNQNIEVTTMVYNVRELLTGIGCRENLAGFSRVTHKGQITSLREVLKFLDGTSSISKKFSTEKGLGGSWSQTGLELAGFSLDPKGIDQMIRPDRTYLMIHLLRPEFQESFVQQVRVFTKETNGVITDCSLVPFGRSKELWTQKSNTLKFIGNSLAIGKQEFINPLSIKGGLYSTPKLTGCSSSSIGNLSYSEEKGMWLLCSRQGVVGLKDMRMLR